MKLHNVTQGDGDWKRLRLGVLTASELDAIVTPEFKPRTGQTPETYLYQKLCEKLLGYATDVNTFAMEQGTILEGEAKPWFEAEHNIDILPVGFCTTDDGTVGCSPDGLIGEDGGIEIKCPQPHTHLRYLMQGGVPKDYLAQVHGSMFVTGRRWWKFMSYSRQFEPLIVHVERDERIQAHLAVAIAGYLARFDRELAAIAARRDAIHAAKTAEYNAKITLQQCTGSRGD